VKELLKLDSICQSYAQMIEKGSSFSDSQCIYVHKSYVKNTVDDVIGRDKYCQNAAEMLICWSCVLL